MNKTLKRLLSLMLVLIMMLTIVAPLSACGGNPPPDDNGDEPGTGGGKITHTVTVQSAGKLPLSDIIVSLYKQSEDGDDLIAFNQTGENGKVTFADVDEGNYYVTIVASDGKKLNGYNVHEKYTLNSTGATVLSLTSAPISTGSANDISSYKLGDIIYDYTLTDVNGRQWKISDVLKEKNMLLLNFWYTGCGPCVAEFPYMAKAYNKWSEYVEIFAIDDSPYDTATDVMNFTTSDSDGNIVPINFPLFKTAYGSNPNYAMFGGNGWPTTVAIDRYGMICLIEIGGMPSEKPFLAMFEHFTKENYTQTIIEDINVLTPQEKPNVSMPESSVISEYFEDSNNRLNLTYVPYDDEYSWPFVTTEYGGVKCIKPSNSGYDGSFAIITTTVDMKAGEALAFDYLSSTHSNYDILYTIVNGEDILAISGVKDDWDTAYTFVAEEDGSYEITLAYIKDGSDAKGDDTVYLRNLRIVDANTIDKDTYIYRDAATKENEAGDGYGEYVTVVYNEEDGLYHVRTADGPLLFVNLTGYTNFDQIKTVFERLYADVYDANGDGDTTDAADFLYASRYGIDDFLVFESYGTMASNSRSYGYVPVTEELKELLIYYVNDYREAAGKAANDNLWLQLCCYYDAYGKDVKQLEDPSKGLAAFNAFDAVMGEENYVEYNSILVPRGYLYEFVPETSGVYRITSNSRITADGAYSVVGWIFTGNDRDWAINSRDLYTSSEVMERVNEELVYVAGYTVICSGCGATLAVDEDDTSVTCPDKYCGAKTTDLSGKQTVSAIDRVNISMAAYMEAGQSYYICIAYHTVEQTGSFTFDVEYVGESFNYFVAVSPGFFTYEVGNDANILAGGTDVKLCDIDGCQECAEAAAAAGSPAGTKYYHALNDNGTLGSVVYADFTMYTDLFSTQSIIDLININGFNFAISEKDREALQYISDMERAGKEALFESWGNIPNQTKINRWNEYCMDAVLDGDYSGLMGDAEKIAKANEYLEIVNAGADAYIKEEWGDDYATNWADYQMEDVMAGIYHPDESNLYSALDKQAMGIVNTALTVGKARLLETWDGTAAEKNAKWEEYTMDAVLTGDFSGISGDMIATATEYANAVRSSATDYIRSSVWTSEDTFNTNWALYKMDDLLQGIYHGTAKDFTDEIIAYANMMRTDENRMELRGCVAVDEGLAELLQLLVDTYSFDNVESSWRKLCYYYTYLGA